MKKTYRSPFLHTLIWSVLIASWFGWYVYDELANSKREAIIQARNAIEKDILYRHWNAQTGGIYAPVSEEIAPNPYLVHLPERDVVTESGKKLTLINPAYMTRMVYELAVKEGLYAGHITSLFPLRPENRADLWESNALKLFEHGIEEAFSEETYNALKTIRFMKPLKTEQGCLKCHAGQGYQLGDVIGGISVAVSMLPYEKEAIKHIRTTGAGVIVIWILGCIGVFIATRSITQREVCLENAAAEWKVTFDAIEDFVSVHDVDFRFTRVNKSLASFLGKSAEELLGKKCHGELHCTEFPHPQCPLEESIATGQSVTREVFDESLGIPLLVSTSPIYSSTGKISGFVHIAKNMTEIKRVHDAMERSEARYRNLFEQAPLSYLSLDRYGNLIDVNEALTEMFGFARDELVGKSFGEFVPPNLRTKLIESFQQPDGLSESIGLEFEMVKKDGTKIVVSIDGKIGDGIEGEVRRTHCILHNVTEKKRRAEELRRYQNELEKLVAERTDALEEVHQQLVIKERLATIGKLSGSVAHDIRNPLGAISNSIYYINLISDAETDVRIKKHIGIMEKEIERVKHIIDDLMDFSRENPPNFSKGDLNRLILHYAEDLDMPEGVELTVDLDEQLPIFSFDSILMQRIIDNLVTNGIQAMVGSGLLSIRTRVDEAIILLEICDQGVGIDPENIGAIFEPLYTTKSKGVGLGLFIVKTSVEKHKGTIEVKSDSVSGTTFRVTFPLQCSQNRGLS